MERQPAVHGVSLCPSDRKALGTAAESAVVTGVKGAMLSSGFGAAAMFAGDFASGTIGNMLNRAISGERQNLGESLWGGLTNAVSGRAGGYGKVKGAADAFKRGAMENAARSVMNDIHDMAGIGDAGSRAHGRDSYGTGGDPADTALMNRGKSDPRTQCTPTDTFSGGIGTQSTRGYRQSGSSGKNGTKSRFDLKKILKNAMFNGLMGGLTDTAFYGMDKAVDAAAVGFLGNQRGSGTQRRIAENAGGQTTNINSNNSLNLTATQEGTPFRNVYFKKGDIKMVSDAANQVGVNRTEFGNYIHEVKKDLGMKANQNFTYQELLELAKEFATMMNQ